MVNVCFDYKNPVQKHGFVRIDLRMRSGRKGYKMMTLDGLKTGQSGKILQVNGQGALRHHLLDMGLTPGTVVTLRKVAPMGDPVQIELRGYELTLRLDEAQKMEIEEIQKEKEDAEMTKKSPVMLEME